MSNTDVRHQSSAPFFFLKNTWKALAILLLGLVVTFAATLYIKRSVDAREKNEFALVCSELVTKIDLRLHAHAELLRSCSSFFMASDTVTHVEWKSFIGKSKFERNLPGIQGVGYACIIAKNQLQQHVKTIRGQGFPDYTIKPSGERDIYTSIVYIEPFAGRNLRAFGYDMFSEPVRRKAMEQARDNDMATLSGKVQLVQETYRDVQAGTLMYVPVYRSGKPTNTLAERRAAIVGWVYSPYRMNDLMNGILGRWDAHDDNRIDLKVYDTDSISDNTLLFDSQPADTVILVRQPSSTLTLSVNFNGTVWSLCFSQPEPDLAFYESEVYMVLICGVMISLLLFALALSLIHTKTRAERMAKQLTSELKQSETKFKTVADYTYDWEYWIGTDNRLIYMSPSCERISGYKPEEFFADPLLLKKIMYSVDSIVFDEHLATVHSTKHIHEHAETDFRILKKGGSVVYIEHLCSPVYDEKGIYLGRRISNRDITQAHRDHDLVAQTRRNYETFFNTIDEFLFVLDQQGNIIHTNSTVIDRLGFTWPELKGQSVLMVHPPERRDEAGRIVGLMLQRKAEFCPVPLITKSGMQIPVETRVTAGLWDGKPAIFGVTKDVSQIRLSQEKFSKLFHLNPSAAGLSDLVTGEYLEVNEAFYTLFGFNTDEVIGKSASSLGILTDQTRTSIFRKADIFGNISNLEADLIAKNGDIKRVLLSAENIYIQDKKYRFTVVHDITDWKRIEDDLKAASTRLLLATRAGGVGVWDLDIVNNVLVWDEQMFALYGITKNQFGGAYEAWLAGVHLDSKAQGDAEVQIAINGGKELDTEFKVLWPDGSVHDIRALAVVQRDSSGKPLRMIGTNWDITQQKQTEAEINLQNEELLKLNAEKDKFFSIIAHDLRSPFNGFLGLTKLLSEGATAYSPSEIKSVATSMRKSALALFGLLENLLDWSRMQRGLIPFDPTTLQLLPEAENCIALLHEAALVKRIEVSCFISPEFNVFASSNMLQAVIRNLLSNAIKFTPIGGTVSIFAIPVKDNKIEVAIKDTGIGMDEEIIANLFKLGLSTSRRGTEGEASTGLGLYMCKDFIEKQGGNLWAESRKGFGSTFRFTVPVG